MRTLRVLIAMTLAAWPVVATAQQAPPPPGTQKLPTAPSEQPAPATDEEKPVYKNRVDFGIRGSDLSGDTARYERYRDLGNGPFLQGYRLNKEKAGWFLDAFGNNVGRKDQRFEGNFVRPGKFKGWAVWDQVPMLMSRTTKTLYVEDVNKSPSVLTIPDALQSQVQASTSALPSIFANNGVVFDTKSHRYIGQGGFEYLPNQELTVRTNLKYTDRQGAIPYGGSFGHSSLVEIPAPIKHTLTDFDANAEFARDPVLLRAGFAGSWFHNDVTTVTFDNPFRVSDLAATPSRGRLSLPPSNSLLSVNGMASVKLPHRTRATGYVSIGSLKDAGDPLMPQTINSAFTTLPLERDKVEGEARTSAVNLTFTSRPTPLLDFSAHYRLYDYDNRTPEFAPTQRVSYDNTPATPTFSTLGGSLSPLVVETEPFGVKRQTFDADFRVTPMRVGAAGVGYSRVAEDRTHRFFESTVENTLRLSFDAVQNVRFSVRTKYEHSQRRGDVTEEAQRELFNIGEQPALRQFDIASRDRDRITVLGSILASEKWAFNGSVAAGKDDYIESVFGLRDNTHRVYSAGVDGTPAENLTVGGSYSYERYVALLHSRQASPPAASAAVSFESFLQLFAQPTSTVQVADASRNWANEGADRVHSILFNTEIANIASKVDLRFSYDYSRARALYTYATGRDIPRTLPEDVPPPDSTLPTPTQLPLIKSQLQRGTADLVYSLTPRVGVGVSYWYERYDVSDFTLDADANKDLARGSALLLGYLYRPYTANTVWGRILVRW